VRTWTFLVFNFNQFDVIQNFGRLLYLLPVLKTDVKKIMCYQRKINSRNIKLIQKLSPNNMFFSACSKSLVIGKHLEGKWNVVYNPVKMSFYNITANNNNDSPLIYLSRINKQKGCHIAIEVAKKTNNKLIIAGNIDSDENGLDYFRAYIEPYIDGEQIVYIGEVNDIQKRHHLTNAKAMLFPITWEEPFGIVMIESMACGTPVVAFNCGSVDEVIDEGITGYKVANEEEMIYAISTIKNIDRVYCREHAKKRFDVSVIASNYMTFN